MAKSGGHGPPPKPDDQRRRRNASPIPSTVLPAGGYSGPSPELPPDVEWHHHTLDWYDTWRHAPQAAVFIDTDWQRLHLLARLIDAFVRSESPSEMKMLLAEVRLNEGALGALVADRARLRMGLGDPEVGPVTRQTRSKASDARRARALKAVGTL